MKPKLIYLLGVVLVLSSCSSAYRIGQTPDDVYYSPAPPQDDYVTTENQQDKDSYAYNNSGNNQDLDASRGIIDPGFNNSISFYSGSGYYPYNYYGSSLFSPYNSSWYNPFYSGVTFYPNNFYNSFYSPYSNYYSPFYDAYYSPIYYNIQPGIPLSNYSGPRRYNLGVYNVNTNRTTPVTIPTTNSSAPVRTFKPQPNTSGFGGFVRRIFTPSNNNTSRRNNNSRSNNNYYDNNYNNNNAPARTFQPGSSSGNNNSSSGSSGGGAPVRTFRH